MCREDEDSERNKGPSPQFLEYTSLNIPKEIILQECVNIEFNEGTVKYPHVMKESPDVDKTRLWRFYKCHGHETDQSIHQKNAIEYLIKKGIFGRYTKEDNPVGDNKGTRILHEKSFVRANPHAVEGTIKRRYSNKKEECMKEKQLFKAPIS